MPNFSTHLWVGRYYPLLGVMQTTSLLVVMIGVGHNAVIQDDAGNWYIVYHGFDTDKPGTYGNSNRRSLLIDKLEWDGDFPQTKDKIAGKSGMPLPVIK